MNITEVRIFPVGKKGSTKAYASITFDDALVVRDLRIVEGKNGLFVSMPSKRKKNGEFQDICYPLTAEFREVIQKEVIEKFQEEVA